MSWPLLCLVPKGGFITTVSTLHNAELKKEVDLQPYGQWAGVKYVN